MAHPYIDQVKQIIDLGAIDVLKHQQTQTELEKLYEKLKIQELEFYKLIKYENKHITNARDFNLLIQEIDNKFNTSTMLPEREIEQQLSKFFILHDTEKTLMTDTEREIVTKVLNTLINEGLNHVDRTITKSKAAATVLSSVKDRIWPALQKGINIVLTSNKKNIIDPELLSNDIDKSELLGLETLYISTDTIRGSQAKRDFDYVRDGDKLISVTIRTDAAKSFEPLQNLSKEFREYLIEIAPEVYKKYNFDTAILNENTLAIQQDWPKPLGSVSINLLKEKLIEILKTTIPYYSSEIDLFTPDIAIGLSLSNIRGFLGELRAALLMNELFGNNEAIKLVSTGLKDKIRMSKEGQLQEAPLDFVVKSLNILYGFQVKNTIDTSYSWSNEMSAGSFYIQRLQQNMSDNERNFYSAFSYNQPLDIKDVKDTEIDDWNLYNRKIYPLFISTFEETFVPVFKSLATNIIRLETLTQGDNEGIFSKVSSMTNNFFIMQDKIIAASDIVQALINNKNSRSRFSMSAGTDIKKIWSNGMEPINNNLANQTKINYEVTLNYKTLFKSAYNIS